MSELVDAIAMEYKDAVGQKIQVGDRIACAMREGNVGVLALGTVKELTVKRDWNRTIPGVKWRRDGCVKDSIISVLSNMVVIK